MQKKPLKNLALKVLSKKMQLAVKGGNGPEKPKSNGNPPPPCGNPR